MGRSTPRRRRKRRSWPPRSTRHVPTTRRTSSTTSVEPSFRPSYPEQIEKEMSKNSGQEEASFNAERWSEEAKRFFAKRGQELDSLRIDDIESEEMMVSSWMVPLQTLRPARTAAVRRDRRASSRWSRRAPTGAATAQPDAPAHLRHGGRLPRRSSTSTSSGSRRRRRAISAGGRRPRSLRHRRRRPGPPLDLLKGTILYNEPIDFVAALTQVRLQRGVKPRLPDGDLQDVGRPSSSPPRRCP